MVLWPQVALVGCFSFRFSGVMFLEGLIYQWGKKGVNCAAYYGMVILGLNQLSLVTGENVNLLEAIVYSIKLANSRVNAPFRLAILSWMVLQ